MKQHELYASIRVELPEMPQQRSGVVADVSTAWAKMLEAIGIEVEETFVINEVRTKAKTARKPRLVPVNPEAA